MSEANRDTIDVSGPLLKLGEILDPLHRHATSGQPRQRVPDSGCTWFRHDRVPPGCLKTRDDVAQLIQEGRVNNRAKNNGPLLAGWQNKGPFLIPPRYGNRKKSSAENYWLAA